MREILMALHCHKEKVLSLWGHGFINSIIGIGIFGGQRSAVFASAGFNIFGGRGDAFRWAVAAVDFIG